ncbi:MAG: hypothetical protein P4L65_04365 [Legionella sp.]|nr:hypothetical protein [Legionella sp.]
MNNPPQWCISLNTWIRFHAGENGMLQIQMARKDEHNSFLTTSWEPLAPSSDYLYCQKDGEEEVCVYYYPDDNCLYRFDGISKLTKAAQVSIAQISHNDLLWHAAKKHSFNASLIVMPENVPDSRPLTPEAQQEQWQHLKETHHQFQHEVDTEFNEEQRNELVASFSDVLHEFHLKDYDSCTAYLDALHHIIHNKDNPLHQLLVQQAARTVDFPSIDSTQAGAFLKKKQFFFNLLVKEYNAIDQQFKVPELNSPAAEKPVPVDVKKERPSLESLQGRLGDLQATTHTSSFKQKELHHYTAWVVTALSKIFKSPSENDKTLALKEFLKNNWAQVKGTSLSPTAIPDAPVTALLCDIAQGVALEQESTLQCLMPGLSLETLSDDYPSLEGQQDLVTVLKTHILSDDGLSLLPISLLSELDLLANLETHGKQYNPYFDFTQQKPESALVSASEYERLFKHSEYTKALFALRKNHESLLHDSSNLLGQLTRLCRALELNSIQGRGKDDNASAGAYPAIIAFNDYYQQLTEDTKKQIPPTVKNAIELLLNLSSDPTKNINATENYQTCIATRRGDLIQEMKGHEALLEGITVSAEKKNSLLSETKKNYEQAQHVLGDVLQAPSSYQGSDALRINSALLKTIGLVFRIHSLHDLSLVQQFESEEMAVFLKEDNVQNDILTQVKTLENLVFFLLDLSLDKLSLFMKTMMPKLSLKLITSKSDLAYLTSALGQEKQQVIESLAHYNWEIAELFKDSGHLSSFQYFLNFPESNPLFLEHVPVKKQAALLQKTTKLSSNVLMLAAKYHPEAVAPILKYTPPEALKTILSQTSKDGYNALMLAARYHPEAVAPILAAVPPEILQATLSQTNKDGYNALILAAQFHPEAVAPILAAILPENLQAILSQTTKDGYNALMLAARCQPEAVAPILTAIPPVALQALLSQTIPNGYNALMLAAQYHPGAVAPILTATPPEALQTILNQKTTDGSNVLMIAAQCHPDAVTHILAGISPDALQVLLSQTTEDGSNALMLATQYHPEAVASILAAVPPAALQVLLSQITTDGYNALILAARYHSEAVAPILAAIPPEALQAILSQTDNSGCNALMLAAQYHPEAVAPILAAIPPEALQAILSQTDNSGCNALMLAARSNPEAVAPNQLGAVTPILTAIPQKALQAILNQKTKDGFNVLMIAAQCHPEAVAPILAVIPPEALQVLLSQTDNSGRNALMLAAQYQPEAVASILAAIPPEALQAILSQTDNTDCNALMIAAQCHPEAVAPILATIPPEALQAILSQTTTTGDTTTTGYNALMFAALDHPEAVAPILAATPPEALQAILSQTTTIGYNALMLAALYHPEAVAPILAAIPPEALQAILSQTAFSANALMLAAQHHPEAVAPILAAIPPEALQAILSQTTEAGANALMLAAQYHPEAVAPILAAIPPEALQVLLSQTDNSGCNALMLAAKYHPEAVTPILARISQEARETILTGAIKRAEQINSTVRDITKCDAKEKTNLAAQLEIQISWELIQLAKKTTLFKQLPDAHKEGSRFAVASKLSNELNAQFQKYLDSPTNPQKEQVLLNGFNNALADKKNEILYQHRNPFLRVLQNIVNFVGRLFSIKSAPGQGVLKTDTAEKINTLEYLITQHSLAKLNPTVDYKAQLKNERDQSGPEEPVSLTI